jgi:hypothetical protein
MTFRDLDDLAISAGTWASLPVDFLVKFSGYSDIRDNAFGRFPHLHVHPLTDELIMRTMRMNCLTADYSDLWAALYKPSWANDRWTFPAPGSDLQVTSATWSRATPLRLEGERRRALVEIDALVAVMLGITAEQLCSIYRTQFGQLRNTERRMQIDRCGRQVSKEVLRELAAKGGRADLGTFAQPFLGVDREAEMTLAHAEFSRGMQERAT